MEALAERVWYGVWGLLYIILRVVIEHHWQALLSLSQGWTFPRLDNYGVIG